MTDREIFQRNFINLMEKEGITQQQLADEVGVKRATVSAWITGRGYPRANVMERISNFFGIKLSDLVMSKDESEQERRLIVAWRGCDPVYQKVILELLEMHQVKLKEISKE